MLIPEQILLEENLLFLKFLDHESSSVMQDCLGMCAGGDLLEELHTLMDRCYHNGQTTCSAELELQCVTVCNRMKHWR